MGETNRELEKEGDIPGLEERKVVVVVVVRAKQKTAVAVRIYRKSRSFESLCRTHRGLDPS